MTKEDRRERLERCKRRIAEKPDSAVAHYNLGLAYTSIGKMTSAEEAYRKALDLDPEMVQAWVNLGGTLLSRWDFEGSKKANNEALARDGESLLAHYNMGQACLYLGEAEEVVMCNRRVTEIDPDHPAGHYFLAVGLLATDQAEAARKHLAIAMRLGHRPAPEFLRGLERADKNKDSEQETPNILTITGAEAPKDSKED